MRTMRVFGCTVGLALLFGAVTPAAAQTGFGGFGGRFGTMPQTELVARFDENGDGRLDDREREEARSYIRGARGSRSYSSSATADLPIVSTLQEDIAASRLSAVSDRVDLYDEAALRTLYLRFDDGGWFNEVMDFYQTDVEVPADLIVDGEIYRSVGVHFRGSSSFGMTGSSKKKSFGISIDYDDLDQRLYGYRTLNLLNGHADPSFLREALFLHIARRYIPAPKANFVKLVVNGESWGVYVNVQQFNNDFLRDWFGTNDGIRWKVPVSRGATAGLVYSGSEPSSYSRFFELKTGSAAEAWEGLIRLTEVLQTASDNELEETLGAVMNIDEVLWYLALENVFIDSDGYFSRGSDYFLYQDPDGRFSMIPHDSNETFRFAGGGGPNRWPSSDPMLSPVGHENNELLPVIQRLLNVPYLRQRYLAHIRTIVDEWLDWGTLEPIIRGYRSLIEREVEADDKKLYSYSAFIGSIEAGQSASGSTGGRGSFGYGSTVSLETFIEERRGFLENHPELKKPEPKIRSVDGPSEVKAGEAVTIAVETDRKTDLDAVILYYSAGPYRPFQSAAMHDDGRHSDGKAKDGVFAATIPAFPAGTLVHYYVEARALSSLGTVAFEPERTESHAYSYRVAAPVAGSSPIVINEIMALNNGSYLDPQGDADDWIELHNKSGRTVDLSGMYLSDKQDNPRKWAFPEGTAIPPGGFLLVWADEDDGDGPGLHANFRLNADGELLMLVDGDERNNQVLDLVEYGKQVGDVSYSRLPDGTGGFSLSESTPGRSNRP